MTKIIFFGRLRDIAGCAEYALELPAEIQTIADLRTWMSQRDPMLGEAIQARGVRVAINQSFCVDDAETARGAREIAFMSPLSGG